MDDSTPSTIAPASVAAITTIGCSVHADTASATAHTAQICTATQPVAIATRPSAPPNDNVVPDNVIMPCDPITMRPVIMPTAEIRTHAVSTATATPNDLTTSSRTRPTGATNSARNVPLDDSPASASADHIAPTSGNRTANVMVSATIGNTKPLSTRLLMMPPPPPLSLGPRPTSVP